MGVVVSHMVGDLIIREGIVWYCAGGRRTTGFHVVGSHGV